jgi:hypothetical protein
MKVFVLTEEALTEVVLGVARYAKACPNIDNENYVQAAINHIGRNGAEVVLSYEEEQRMRRAECPE